jgi:hypothetical protein
MGKVDQMSQHIVIDARSHIKFSKEDIRLVFGIPCSGRNVLENGIPRKEFTMRIMEQYLGVHSREICSIKSSYEVLIRDFSGTMSPKDEDCLRIAFVVYVMSTLLAPGAKYDYAPVVYCNGFEVPSLIWTYDWGQY